MNDFQNAASTREKQLSHIKHLNDLVVTDGEIFSSSGNSTEPVFIEVNESTVLRNISGKERETLTSVCRCSFRNNHWFKLYLLLSKKLTDEIKDYSSELETLVSGTHFDGFIILDLTETIKGEDSFEDNDLLRFPAGVHDNILISDSIVSVRTCRVYRNSFISRTYIGPKSVVLNCGYITASKFNYGKMKISVGAETGGGRDLFLTTECTMIEVDRQLKSFHEMRNDEFTNSLAFNVFSERSVIRDTAKIQNVYLYQSSSIEASCSVINSTLFSDAKISNSSTVSNVIMQWHATISDNSTIRNVFMMEHSHCGPSSIIESSVMGPDTHASAGEIHASVIGPMTNAHHQSLLIGVLWPLGRGNVAYGANVGSNHTGRLPDQECSAGEGTFWGLSCIAKFPLNLSQAPYTLIGAGTRLSPQRITMPFSLIVESVPSSSSSKEQKQLNDIIPGWVIHYSPYTLIRNGKKYIDRRKARRHAFYTGWKIFRPDIIERCREARRILKSSMENSSILENQVGECRLSEKARDTGIKAYDDCIQHYALQGLLSWLNKEHDKLLSDCDLIEFISRSVRDEFMIKQSNIISCSADSFSSAIEWPSSPWVGTTCEWEYQRSILLEEFSNEKMIYDLNWLQIQLEKLRNLENKFAEQVLKSKQKDDNRGAKVIPGYSISHIDARNDPVIIAAKKKAKDTEQIVESFLNKINL